MESLIDSITNMVASIGFDRALIMLLMGAAIFHFVSKSRNDNPTKNTSKSYSPIVPLTCAYDASVNELTLRRLLDPIHNDVRRIREDIADLKRSG